MKPDNSKNNKRCRNPNLNLETLKFVNVFTVLLTAILMDGFICKSSYASSLDQPPTLILNSAVDEPLSNKFQSGKLDKIATEAFRRCGYRLVVDKLPAERALRSANNGLIDGDISRIKGLDRLYPHLIRVPEKIFDMNFVAFSKKKISMENGWNSLENYSVSYITGWKIYEKNSPKSAKITATRNSEQLFTLLARDRTDIALHNRVGGNYIVSRFNINNVVELKPPLAVKEMYVYLNKKYAELVPKLAKALGEMKSDGTYARYLESSPE